MTPEQKRLLADALIDSAVQTADEAAKLGLRDIPEGALRAACGLPETPANNQTQQTIQDLVHRRIALRLDSLSNPPQTRLEMVNLSRQETDLYRDLLSNIFATEGLNPDPQRAGVALTLYYQKILNEAQSLDGVLGSVDMTPSTVVEVPTFSEICRANKAGREL